MSTLGERHKTVPYTVGVGEAALVIDTSLRVSAVTGQALESDTYNNDMLACALAYMASNNEQWVAAAVQTFLKAVEVASVKAELKRQLQRGGSSDCQTGEAAGSVAAGEEDPE